MSASVKLCEGRVCGRWTLLRPAPRDGFWICRCECNTQREVDAGNLASGHSQSCGCLRTEHIVEASTRHGHAPANNASIEYEFWQTARKSCSDPSRDSYPHYGGKGIKVAPEWDVSFERFLADVGPCPAEGMVLGRKNKAKDFAPGNVVWTTTKGRALKKSDMREVTIDGVTKQLCEWAESSGISKTTLHWRLDHWPEERWLDPPRARRRQV